MTRTTATAIDHIITDAILESTMHSGIIKANISDHFPIFTILENSYNKNKNYEKTKITKRDFSNENIQNFQFLLENIKWDQFMMWSIAVAVVLVTLVALCIRGKNPLIRCHFSKKRN